MCRVYFTKKLQMQGLGKYLALQLRVPLRGRGGMGEVLNACGASLASGCLFAFKGRYQSRELRKMFVYLPSMRWLGSCPQLSLALLFER